MADPSRRLSLFLCDQLAPVVTELKFLPEQGTSATLQGDEPIAVPIITEAREVNPGSNVYMADVNLMVQTSADDIPVDTHSDWVGRIVRKIQEIRGACPQANPQRQIYINGLFIVDTHPILGEQSHNTVIELKVGCQAR